MSAALTLLSGCQSAGTGFSFLSAREAEPEGQKLGQAYPKSTKTTLANGSVTVAAPKGFCIDDASVSSGLTGGSMVLARCTALDGKGADSARSAIMTVTVTPRRANDAAAPTLDDLVTAVDADLVLAQAQKGDVALVHVSEGGDDVFPSADPKHWRAVTALDTRLVMLALYAPQGAALAGPNGADQLLQLARGVSTTRSGLLPFGRSGRAASEDQGDEDAAKQGVAGDAPVADPDATAGEKGLLGAIGGLFNRS